MDARVSYSKFLFKITQNKLVETSIIKQRNYNFSQQTTKRRFNDLPSFSVVTCSQTKKDTRKFEYINWKYDLVIETPW